MMFCKKTHILIVRLSDFQCLFLTLDKRRRKFQIKHLDENQIVKFYEFVQGSSYWLLPVNLNNAKEIKNGNWR
jgi:hypothetical protein